MGLICKQSNLVGFKIYMIDWSDRDIKRKTIVIPVHNYASYGLHHNMSFAEAKSACSKFNKNRMTEKRKQIIKNKNLIVSKKKKELYVPEIYVIGFEKEIDDIYFLNEPRLKQIKKHWNIVVKIISNINISPSEYYNERNKFYFYYNQKKWSPAYIKELTSLINRFGEYCCRQDKLFFKELPQLSNVMKEKLNEAREEQGGFRTVSEALTVKMLIDKKHQFETEGLQLQYNFMFIALWFGLRPKELDSLKDTKNYKIEYDNHNKVNVLHVYQSKLTSLQKAKRWKPIPIMFKEQEEALELIKACNFKRPLVKTLKRIFEDNIDTYSGRKGFTDLMLSKGVGLENISIFLGHSDISMTWKHYKNRNRFNL